MILWHHFSAQLKAPLFKVFNSSFNPYSASQLFTWGEREVNDVGEMLQCGSVRGVWERHHGNSSDVTIPITVRHRCTRAHPNVQRPRCEQLDLSLIVSKLNTTITTDLLLLWYAQKYYMISKGFKSYNILKLWKQPLMWQKYSLQLWHRSVHRLYLR